MPSPASHPRDPLHGIKLENIINQLVQRHGWKEMGHRIPIRCFQFNPTVKSSLTFLRKTPKQPDKKLWIPPLRGFLDWCAKRRGSISFMDL